MSAVITAFVLLTACSTTFAAFHDYHDDYFFAVGDAFIFRGGREGLFASSAQVQSVRPLYYHDEALSLLSAISVFELNRLGEIGRTLGKLHLGFQTGRPKLD